MAEPDKRQIGDGSDNYGEAAKQMAKAAKEAAEKAKAEAPAPVIIEEHHELPELVHVNQQPQRCRQVWRAARRLPR